MTHVKKNDFISPVQNVTDDAGGVGKSHWFVAIVRHNTEKKVAENLRKLGHEHYLPTQCEHKVRKNGRKVTIERILIPSTIFIRCTGKERREIVKLPFINRFMTDKAKSTADIPRSRLATIPDEQIRTLKFMVGNSDSPVTITSDTIKEGDLVRVTRGKLTGLTGKVATLNEKKTTLTVTLDYFGSARLEIDTINVERIG